MRVHGLLIAIALCAVGCQSGETVLRLTIAPGSAPAPAALRLTLGGGVTVAPRMVAPVSLPGTVVVHGLPAAVTSLCVQVDALDDGGAIVGQAAATVALEPHGTARASATLAAPGADTVCPAAADLGAPDDGASDGGVDGAVPSCPAAALFCDDFESDDLTRWDYRQIKYRDMGTLARTMARAAHGQWSLEGTASGVTGQPANYADVEKDFSPALTPPLAVRVNLYSPQPLGSYTMFLSLVDTASNAISVGGNKDFFWTLSEDLPSSSTTLDHPSDMVPASGGQWHCVELVIDGAGNISTYVDEHRVIGPFQRAIVTQYSSLLVGVVRSVVAPPGADLFVDDVAVGPSRLYCP